MDEPLRIAFVLDGGFVNGGAERVAARLLDYWAQEGRHVDVITKYGPAIDFYPIPASVNRIVIGDAPPTTNPLLNLVRMVRNLWRLRQAIRNSQAQVVISFLTIPNLRTILAATGLGKRIVVSERNDVSRQNHPWPVTLLRRLLYRYANAVTANSNIAVASLAALVPAAKLAYVPNPVEFPARPAAPETSCTILNVARLTPQKAQSLLIQAFAGIATPGNGWRLEIVGAGPERAKLEQLLAEYDLDASVTLCGQAPDPSPYYLAAGIFVLPSLYEGTPNALLEAMAHGLPAVVADTLPGALEHIEDGVTGLVFRGGDKADLAAKLTTLMNNPDQRAQLGRAARARMQRLTPEYVLQQWDAVLFPQPDRRPSATNPPRD